MASTDSASSVFRLKGQSSVFLIGLGHGGTHWVAATFLLLQPYIRDDLGLSYAQAGVLVAMFQLSSFLANFGSGVVVDLTGRRVLFQGISLLVGAGALLAFGFTKLFIVLLAMVALIGASNNLWHPAAIAYLSSEFPRNRGYVLSIHALGASFGDAVAPLAAGALLVAFTWQETAVVNAIPVFLLAAALMLFLMPKDAPTEGTAKRGMGFRDYLDGMKLILRNKAVLGLSLMAGFRSMAQNGLLIFLPFYLADVLKVSPVVMGAALMAMHVGGMIAGPIAGTMSDRIGRRPIVLAGLTATTAIILGATFIGNAMIYIGCISVLGFVLYAVRPVIHSWMMDMVPDRLGASATSLLFGTQAMLSILTPLIGGLIADAYGLVEVFYFIAAMMLIANMVVVLLPKNERADTAE